MASDLNTSPVGTWLPMRGPFSRWPRVADALLALLVFACNVFISDEEQDVVISAISQVPPEAIFFFALSSGALYWRRRRPLAVLGTNLVVLVVLTGLGFSNSVWALPFALYGVSRYASESRWSYLGVGSTVTLATIMSAVEGEPIGNIAFAFVFLFLIWYFGRFIRVRGDYLHLLEQRATELEREKDQEARRVLADERTRIARELHDVVAHRVSLMTVQAGAAKTVAADDPQGALQAMQAVETAGRQALDELRHLMGVLRPEAETGVLGPQPGIADIPELVEQLREAGLQVSLTIAGDFDNLPARVALAAYRIVQESMTNVLKHAGPNVHTQIHLRTDNDEVAIDVLDTGRGATTRADSGHGIVGMRERAQILGGQLEAKPRDSGGFQVIARLPIGDRLK